MAETGEQTANGNGNGVHIKTRWGTFDAKRGSEFIAIICLAMMCAGAYGVYSAALTLADALKSMAKQQRLMACIISADQKDREAQWANPNSRCNRDAERL
jgi:purine-cytosine permease-like protein